MIVLVLIALIVIAGVVQGALAPARLGGAQLPDSTPPYPDAEPDLSPTELSLVDPVEALRLYGTPADAARLTEQGTDLSALGYRGSGDDS